MVHTHRQISTLMIGFAVLCAGCGSLPPTTTHIVFVSPSHEPDTVNNIAIFPVVDSRVNNSIKIDFETKVQRAAEKELKKLGYEAHAIKGSPTARTITPQNLTFPTPEWIGSLETGPSRWAMIFQVEKTECVHFLLMNSYYGYDMGFSLNCYLFDKQQRCLAWRKELHANCIGMTDLFSFFLRSDSSFIPIKAGTKNLVDSLTKNKNS